VSRFVVRWLAMPPNLRGILWVAISGFLFALLNVFTLIPAQHLNSYVMAFLRYFFGSLFSAADHISARPLSFACIPGGCRCISSAARFTPRA